MKAYKALLVLLACALLAAGCGGGGGSKSSGGGSSGSSTSSAVKQGVQTCKDSVDRANGLSASVKKDLKDICDKAGSGDADAVRKATQDVCVKIVEQNTPAGAARDQAVSACKQGTQ